MMLRMKGKGKPHKKTLNSLKRRTACESSRCPYDGSQSCRGQRARRSRLASQCPSQSHRYLPSGEQGLRDQSFSPR